MNWFRKAPVNNIVILLSSLTIAFVLYKEGPAGAFGGGVMLDAATKSLGAVKAGAALPVAFRMTNHSDRVVRCLGANKMCTRQGCFTIEGMPLSIPPGETREIPGHVTFRSDATGDFSATITLYCDYQPMPQIPLSVGAVIVK